MNLNLIYIAFTLCFLFVGCNLMHSQNTTSEKDVFLKRNIIHGSLAPDIAYNAVHVFYDRIVYENSNIAVFARVGYGGWFTLLVNSGTTLMGQGGVLFGSGKGRFEVAVGAAKINQTQYSENHDKTDPAINIGYRRNVPGKHFLFRTGIGYPEGIYFGVGYAL
ncbi:MAG TPA: hypothetical protein VIS27_09740 [Yeosuana sp.]